MAMSYVWALLVIVSLVWGISTGTIGEVSAAALEGAGEAVKLALTLAGVLCLWNGVIEVMKRAGIDRAVARAARPLLRRLYPGYAQDDEVLSAAAANMSANILGLGNAATPLGLKAAKLMCSDGTASDDLVTLMILNTASIQLIPATVAALRAGMGSATPFDILPAVWVTSAVTLAAGLTMNRVLRRKRA